MKKLGKRMLLPPLILALLMGIAILWLGVPMSLEFSSGTILSYKDVQEVPNLNQLESQLKSMLGGEVKAEETKDPVTGKVGLDIQTTTVLDQNLENQVTQFLYERYSLKNAKILVFAPALGETYRRQAVQAITVAVVVIGLCLLIVYRRKIVLVTIPCILLDLLAGLGGLALTSTPLSLASLAGLLLLLGYGVDTNVLLSNSVIKRPEGEPEDRVASAMKTGFTITGTTLLTMLLINLFVNNPSIDQLSTVLIFGLAADLLNTWFLNASFLIWWARKRKGVLHYVSL